MKTIEYLLLCLFAVIASPAPAQTVVYKAVWGEYGLQLENTGAEGQRLRIIKDGHTLIQVEDYMLSHTTAEITGRPPTELIVSGFSGGAHCCTTNYVFTQEGGLRNILVQFGGDGGISTEDLDEDGKDELVFQKVYSYFGDLPFSESPVAVQVFTWDGARFYDATLRYPQPTKQLAAEYRNECQEKLIQGADDFELEGCALGFWANSLLTGQGANAKSWLMQKMPYEVRKWLLANEEDILNSVSPLKRSYDKKFPPER